VNEEDLKRSNKLAMIYKGLDGEVAELGAYFAKRGVNPYSAAIIMSRLIAMALACNADLETDEEPTDEVSEDA